MTVITTWSGTLGRAGLLHPSGRAVADSFSHTITDQRGAKPATAQAVRYGRRSLPIVPHLVVATVISSKFRSLWRWSEPRQRSNRKILDSATHSQQWVAFRSPVTSRGKGLEWFTCVGKGISRWHRGQCSERTIKVQSPWRSSGISSNSVWTRGFSSVPSVTTRVEQLLCFLQFWNWNSSAGDAGHGDQVLNPWTSVMVSVVKNWARPVYGSHQTVRNQQFDP